MLGLFFKGFEEIFFHACMGVDLEPKMFGYGTKCNSETFI